MRFWAVVLCALLLTGCAPRPQPTPPRIVTEVTVTRTENGTAQQVRYTNGEKIGVILDYLRLADPYGKPDTDPESLSGPEYRIELHYSRWPSKVYRQKADRYMMSDGKWQSIKKEHGEYLRQIIDGMAGDG